MICLLTFKHDSIFLKLFLFFPTFYTLDSNLSVIMSDAITGYCIFLGYNKIFTFIILPVSLVQFC